MDNRSIWRGVAFALVAAGAAVAIGVGAYNAGVEQGLLTNGHALAGPYYWGHPWGHGFIFFPFLGVLLLFVLVRRIFWWRSWRGRGYCRYEGVPPAFEEWHRRAHAPQNPSQGTTGTTPER